MKKYILLTEEPTILAGTTLKVQQEPENFNMALHACQNSENVMDNRKKMAEDFNLDVNQFVFAKQTHSDHIKKVTHEDMGKGAFDYESGIEDCDALYTSEKGILLGVFHADCVPVLLYDPVTQIVAAIHAGWQGTVKEITGKSIAYLKENENVNPANLRVYIGPAICQNNFEVDQDVVEKVKAMSFDTSSFIYHKEEDNKFFVDNKGLNRQQCLNAGVLAENIRYDKNCTYANQENFFSFRKDKNCGRHCTFIMIK